MLAAAAAAAAVAVAAIRNDRRGGADGTRTSSGDKKAIALSISTAL